MNTLDYAIVVIYLVLLVGMGFSFRKQTTKNDYFLGGRTLGWKALTLSVMATQLSAISFVSAPAFVGLREGGGLHWLSYELAVPLAMLLILSTILPALYRSGFVSIYDYLEQRYARSTRILISFVFQFSRAFATGIMIFAVSLILQGTMGIEAWQAIALTGVITVLYSLQGGMKAVVYGDAIQMVIIVLGTVACIGFGLYHLGGFSEFITKVDPERLSAIKPESLGFDGEGFGLLPMIFGGFVLYASYYGCDQTQAQRALAAANTKELRYMMLANATVRFPITLLYCFSGLIVGTLAMTEKGFMAQIPTQNPDWMMPIFILNYLPHGMIGILVVAILAAAMSSLSSAINSLAAVSIEDYCRLTNKTLTPENYLKKAKYVALIWGVVTLGLSFYAGDIAPTVIEAINKVGSVFYGPILAVFLLAVIDKTLGAREINIGLIAGVALNIVIWLTMDNVFWFWLNFIGFVAASTFAYIVKLVLGGTYAGKPTSTDISGEKVSILSKLDIVVLLSSFVIMLVICAALPSLFS